MTPYMRLRQICLVAPHLEPVIPDIAAIMGLAVCYRDSNVAKYGLENALLPVDTILLEVVAPFRDGTAAGRFIDAEEFLRELEAEDEELERQLADRKRQSPAA